MGVWWAQTYFEKGCAKEEWNEECEVAVDGGTRGRFEEQQ